MATSPPASASPGRLGAHLSDPLYRTGYYLILGTGITGVLGIAFWNVAAKAYPAHVVGLNSAVISAMTLVSGVCTLGLGAVLVRYLPVAGRSTRALVVRSYAVTVGLSLLIGVLAPVTSPLWSSRLDFLAQPAWVIGFALATASMTVFTLQDAVLTGLQAARWVPLENSLYSLAKLLLLVALVSAAPFSGPFIAWNAPLPVAVVLINVLIFRRLVHDRRGEARLDSGELIAMARGNYGGALFAIGANFFMPILVTNMTSGSETAYFFIPWMITLVLELIAMNVMISLTLEAAPDVTRLRELCRKALWHTMRLIFPAAVLTAAAAPLVLGAFGSDYAHAGTTLQRLLVVGLIPNVVVGLGTAVARVQERGRVVLAVGAAQFALLVGISAALLPGIGIEAVGIAWTASQTALALVLLATILRPLVLPERWSGDRGLPAA